MMSRSAMSLCVAVLHCACLLLPAVSGHGRLLSPPGRSTMWRLGFRTAKNYQDNELSCGGRWFQWEVHGGKCGVCGDPWGKPQENQPPGKYSRPFLAKCYQYGTEYIDAHVELTANHLGYMKFRLCPNNDFKKPVTQECLNEYPLDISNEHGKLIGKTLRIHSQARNIFLKLTIPSNLTCSQCVLQWQYITGNSWGCDTKGNIRRCGTGLGGQESFWACADVAIVPDCRKPKDYIPSDSYVPVDPGNDNLQENKDRMGHGKPIIEIDEEDLSLSAIIDGKLFGADKKNGTGSGKGSASNAPTSNSGQDGGQGKASSTNRSGRPDSSRAAGQGTETQNNQGRRTETDDRGAGSSRRNSNTQGGRSRPNQDSTKTSTSGDSAKSSTSRDSPINEEREKIKDQQDEAVEKLKAKMTRSPPRVFTRAPRLFRRCIALGLWSGQPHMAKWCEYNCVSGFCPKTMCHCIK